MIKLPTKGRYALRLMIELAQHGCDGKPVSLASVAERTDLSRGYLEQLAQTLRNGGLIEGLAGRYGGYRLKRAAADITLAKIIETVIGPVCLVDCIDTPESCMRAGTCECRMVYDLINRRIVGILEEYTLGDLLEPGLLHEKIKESSL